MLAPPISRGFRSVVASWARHRNARTGMGYTLVDKT